MLIIREENFFEATESTMPLFPATYPTISRTKSVITVMRNELKSITVLY